MSKAFHLGPQERLRSLVGAKRWDYLIYWNISDDQRCLEWIGCCCSGADQSGQGFQNPLSESHVFFSPRYFEGCGCRDLTVQHPRTTACDLLADFPSSIPLDAGIQGQVFLSGQPRWMNFPNIADPNAGQDAVQTKVLIPVRNGLVELFVCKPVAENASLVQFVLTEFDLWLPQMFAESNNLFGVSGSAGGGFGSVSETASTLPWLPVTATDSSVPWDSSAADRALSESQLSIHLNFLGQQLQDSNNNKPLKNDYFEGSADSINHSDKPTNDHPLQQDNNNIQAAAASLHIPIMRTSSQLSKENHDKEVKHEFIRADSSDCSDQMEDDVDDQKVVGRSGRRHLSKNLVAERKRRKKLNERLYALRALVPKITKMDRASILGDAIDYIKQLQQQVKELQEELNEMDMQAANPSSPNFENGVQQTIEEETLARCSAKSDVTKPTVNEPTEEMVHTMQIDVSQVDTHVFNLRIFSEKRDGGFVRLMQAMDRLGLDILNANITSFRGLVLNVFNAEMRDKEIIQAEQLRESLLEMTLHPSSSSGEAAASDHQQRHMMHHTN
ncbi:transcription factor ABORTED MICROSPORES isoform X2 [Cryptomeria japonica]|nr:transcription factor ABORTED MICROSPORES isoform X2 [Cryptomeria japonica]